MSNYTVIHCHSDISNIFTTMDSVTKFKMYIDKAYELGMKSIAITEHGNFGEWFKKKQYTESKGMKYIHGVEAYVTENLDSKVRDNFHVLLYATNLESFKELNKLISKASHKDGHFYYQPRISFDELMNTSKDIVISTACLGGILSNGNQNLKDKFIDFMVRNKERCFLEIQHHLVQEQILYNQYLYEISQKTGLRLIAGTDTHSLDERYAEGRRVLQVAKDIHFGDEDGWDLTFKTYDELIQAYSIQNSLPKSVYLEAINNTNVLSDMVEEFTIDQSIKYPKLYDNSEEVFKQKILKGYKQRGIDKKSPEEQVIYRRRIREEFEGYKKIKAIDYILLQEKVISDANANGRFHGEGRGSSCCSLIAYLLNVTGIDSIKYDLFFNRFINPQRLSSMD